MFPHDATLEYTYETPTRARAVENAVAQEIGEIDDERSQTTLERSERTITFKIVAKDLTALRAALNTWMTLVDVAEQAARTGARAFAPDG
ncbi:KEOPS complex subunit Pcc1 [Halobacteria archaeon AArc-curdl1]|uniref:KEOPS complex subunit Pcc1 n=1 Tax=Natronosalvus hydrolyticus TaxID=2979988 RepID=A0AAP2Z7X1_9EURY|nr:KEOPS complex subunit Pcc1 [Halobacteria archaeon AArc-curdl1]